MFYFQNIQFEIFKVNDILVEISKLMKKILIGTSFILSSLITPLLAEETKNLYLSIGGGLTFPSDFEGEIEEIESGKADFKLNTNDPFIYSLAIGKEFEDWRLEFNYSGSTLSSKSFSITQGTSSITGNFNPEFEAKVKSYMLFGYKDIPNETKFTPYIGVGLGSSNFNSKKQTLSVGEGESTIPEFSESVFTYGIKGGVGYNIAENTSLYSEATYLNYASFNAASGEKYDSINSLGISAGLKFNF